MYTAFFTTSISLFKSTKVVCYLVLSNLSTLAFKLFKRFGTVLNLSICNLLALTVFPNDDISILAVVLIRIFCTMRKIYFNFYVLIWTIRFRKILSDIHLISGLFILLSKEWSYLFHLTYSLSPFSLLLFQFWTLVMFFCSSCSVVFQFWTLVMFFCSSCS